jgi:hypothetical protein
MMPRLFRPLFSDSASGGFGGLLWYKNGVNYALLSKPRSKISTRSLDQLKRRLFFRWARTYYDINNLKQYSQFKIFFTTFHNDNWSSWLDFWPASYSSWQLTGTWIYPF